MANNIKSQIIYTKIDESDFICNLVEEKGMQNCNLVNIYIKAGNFIEMQNNNYKKVSNKIYQ